MDPALLSTLVSLKRIFDRISPAAQEFICLCMQQRFTDYELQERGLRPPPTSAFSLFNCKWINSATPGEENLVKLNVKELLNVSSDWKDVNNLRGANQN